MDDEVFGVVLYFVGDVFGVGDVGEVCVGFEG